MTARVPLYHRGEVVAWALVDDDRHDELAARRWTLARSGYAYGSLGGRPHPMHREVVGLKPGEGKVVHHANEDKLDNRRANLEVYADASDHLRAEHPLSYRRRIDALKRTIAADPCWGMRIEKRIALERGEPCNRNERSRVKIPKGVKPEKAVSGAFRPSISHPYLNVESKTLEATNAYVAVRIPVAVDEDDTSGPVPLRALKVAREEKRDTISCNGGVSIKGVGTFERPEVMSDKGFPDLDAIFARTDGAKTIKIGLNPQQLYLVMQALGCPSSPITLEVELTDAGEQSMKRMFVYPLDGVGDAVVMPVRTK